MKIRLQKVHNKNKALIVLFSVFFAVSASVLSVCFLIFRFRPVFLEKAEFAAKNKADILINRAVNEAISGLNTEDFVNIIFREDNVISSINTDTIALNGLKAKICDNLAKNLGKSSESIVYIPIGSLTKYPYLQGFGYKIPVKILFDTSFNIDFQETLKDAGINQVYYETYVVASANFDIISALLVSETNVTSKIPISQTLIVGTVPEQYGFWYEGVRR